MNILDIEKAIAVLRQGGLVAFPTETVYGLGADACNNEALQKIFHAKGRPFGHPLIVHIAGVEQLPEWAKEVPSEAITLAHAFWPGPLTLILKKAAYVSDVITGGQETIGLRVPRHPVAQELLYSFGSGIAAPSANRFGHISPTTADAVLEELGKQIDLILEGGQCEVGLESTILDLSSGQPTILRPGFVTAEEIETILDRPVHHTRQQLPRVSGMMPIHYAPETPATIISSHSLGLYLQRLKPENLPLVCLARRHPVWQRNQLTWVIMPDKPKDYAHELYCVLRDLDKQGFKRILIEAVPEESAWDAIRDRLLRAAGGHVEKCVV